VTLIDEQVGGILEALEGRGYLDDAVVIFTSDHGDCLTDHGHSQKWTMYDTITRVPAIIWSPGRFEAGAKLPGLCQWMDLGATILELAGVELPEWMEAESLLGALQTPGADGGREFVFAEHGRDGILQGTEMMTMVRDERWKMVSFIDHEDGQLFDLQHDPGEVNNLWDAPEHAAEKERLSRALLHWVMRSHYRSRGWKAEGR
jgi:arylsulfatase A-like enzyme